MKAKTKRPKLVFGNYRCLWEWAHRTRKSKDPDNDPDLLVKSGEHAGDVAAQWRHGSNNTGIYIRMHPSSGPVRKIESHGRILMCYESFKLAKFIGHMGEPFWLINYHGSDSMTSRCRSDLFSILVGGHGYDKHEFETDQFAFVPNHLLDAMPEDIKNNWEAYRVSFRDRIRHVGQETGSWIVSNSNTVLRCVVEEYVNLGTYVGVKVAASDFDNEVTDAKMNIEMRQVLKKLKEK